MPLPPGEPPPFLDRDPPAWAARALPTVLLLLFAVAVAALFLVQVPETVSAGFALESLGREGAGQLGGQDLDHHPASQPQVLGDEDPAHAPATQLPLDAVLGAEGSLQPGHQLGHAE